MSAFNGYQLVVVEFEDYEFSAVVLARASAGETNFQVLELACVGNRSSFERTTTNGSGRFLRFALAICRRRITLCAGECSCSSKICFEIRVERMLLNGCSNFRVNIRVAIIWIISVKM